MAPRWLSMRAVLCVCAALTGLFFAFCVRSAWSFTVDDAYITLRYSRNVAEGVGPTFNATGPRAEGYTSVLWMVVLVAPYLFGLDAMVLAKALGVASTVATGVVAARWAWIEAEAAYPKRRGVSASAAATAGACFAVVPSTAIHAVSGMETAVFAALVTCMLAAAADTVRGSATPKRMVAWATLCGLTRPEGNLAAFVVLAATMALVPERERRRLAVLAAAGWVAPLAAYELWRRHYYGLAFPLPFYVKLATPGLWPGAPDVASWLRGPPLHFGLLLAAALVRPPRSLRPALAALAVMTAFFVLPQHQMGYDHRYLAPFDPVLAVLAGFGVARLATRPSGAGPLAVAIGLAVALVSELLQARGAIASDVDYGNGLRSAHERLGRELFELGRPGRLAISDAGAVPYLSHWWTLDLVGLNTASIALSGRPTPADVMAERPDVVVLASARADRFEPWDWNPWETPLLETCERQGFSRVTVRRFADDYWLWVMAPADSFVAQGLAGRNP